MAKTTIIVALILGVNILTTVAAPGLLDGLLGGGGSCGGGDGGVLAGGGLLDGLLGGGGGSGVLPGGGGGLLPGGGGGRELLPGLLPPLTCPLLDIKVLINNNGILGGLLGGLLGSCAKQDPQLQRYSSCWEDYCYYQDNVASTTCKQCIDKSLVNQLGVQIAKCCSQIKQSRIPPKHPHGCNCS